MIFETERLLVRKLIVSDLEAFHKMQSNPKVMQFATGDVKNKAAHLIELKEVINKYSRAKNDFWVYAIERNCDKKFVGTVSLIKDVNDDEIGYRFLEIYWSNGYGLEICKGLIDYCRSLKMDKLVGFVVHENKASAKILEKLNFKIVKRFISEDIKLPETKYELNL